MEVLSPLEGLDEGDWISPRISFSQDYQFSGRCSPKLQFKDSPEEEFSFMFRSSLNVDPPVDDSMLSADELFFNGKLRPLQKSVDDHARNTSCDQGIVGCADWRKQDLCGGGRSIEDNPRCFSMTIESCRGDARRAYMSLNNSRCSSPSRTMSMPRTTPTSPKASSSMISSSAASSSSTMPTTWMMSSSALTSSSSTQSKYSSKFKEFFKLKKMSASKDASSSLTSACAEISRECPQGSGAASCRHPSRSFWPFSRSNSAGESKSAPVASPPPRRSNSANEGKTTSFSLLPTGTPSPSKQPVQQQRIHKDTTSLARRCSTGPVSMPTNSYTEFLPSNSNASTALLKKGLPPLPNSSAKKTGSFFGTAHCGSDAAIVSSQPILSSYASSSHKGNNSLETTKAIVNAEQSNTSTENSPMCCRENAALPDTRNANGDFKPASDVQPMVHKIRVSTASPGRPVRRGVHANVSRNYARGSPGRRGGVWTSSPGRGNVGSRVSIRNLDRGSVSAKGHVRPKDMLSRDGASVRISPVINVAVPSLRGSKASSKGKIFSLGNLFSKKGKGDGGGLHAVLPTPADSQSGG